MAIGKAIGKSKSAVSGKASRLGLNQTREEVKQTHIAKKTFPPKVNKYNRPMEVYTAYGDCAKLKDCTGCRFPIEGTDLFCNAPIEKNDYCGPHRGVCYVRNKH